MQSTPEQHSTPLSAAPTLEEICHRALRQAEATARPVLACFAFPVGRADPLRLAGLNLAGGFRFFWQFPRENFALVAGGAAVRLRTGGPERFGAMSEQVEPLLREAVSGGTELPEGLEMAGPYALGGFSFFEDPEENRWPGFGPAQLVVPEWMMLREGAEAVGMVSGLVTPGESPSPTIERMARVAAEFSGAVQSAGTDEAVLDALGPRPAFDFVDGVEGHRHWIEMVKSALAEIREGTLAKVVLARQVELICREAPSPLPILAQLRSAYPDCFTFMIDPGSGQSFLGASPERLARFRKGEVNLGALASSAPRGEGEEADGALARRLLESEKERLEHQIVVDAILRAVEDCGPLELPAEPQVVRLNNVQHLFTPITLRPTRPLAPLKLLERVHPTPAVGGHPEREALRHIRHHETFDRGWYGAPVGWLNARGEGDFAVALRAAVLAGSRVRLFAGGGIVAGSDPEREYVETQLKLRPILAAFANE